MMTKIKCNVDNLKDVEKDFVRYNEELIEETLKMKSEVINLSEIIKTPKADKLVELFNEFIEEREVTLKEDYNAIKKDLNFAIKHYSDSLDEIEKVVKTSE